MEKKRNYSLDALKFLAMILIVLHHYQQIYGVSFEKVNFYKGKFNFAWVVELFFVLSGFVIIKYIPRIKKGMTLREFYLKRYLRIGPLMILSVLAFDVIFLLKLKLLTGSWVSNKITLWNTFITCLGIQSGWVNSNPEINNPLWYISVLLLCYIIFYILTFLAGKMGVSENGFYIFMILTGIAIQTYKWEAPFLSYNSSRGYTAFFFGILLGKAFEQKKPGPRQTGIALVIIAVLSFLIVRETPFANDRINLVMTFLYYPALIILFNGKVFSTLFARPWAGTLGKISFDAYIWHTCCFELLTVLNLFFHLGIDFGSYGTMAACFLAALIWAAVSYYLLERPIEKKVSRYLDSCFPRV